MSAEGRREAMDRWLANREISDRIADLRTEHAYLLGVASGEIPIPPAENGPGAIVGLWERLDAIDDEITALVESRP